MTRLEAALLHSANLLVGGTGLVWAWMRFLVEPDDPYAIVNHPLQPDVQHLHVLFAPLLVFAVGLIWMDHVAPRLSERQGLRRRTGLGLVLMFVPMVASGYLLQTSTGAGWRTAWLSVHLATAGVWLVGYGLHLLARRPELPSLQSELEHVRDLRPPADPSPPEVAQRPTSASGTRG